MREKWKDIPGYKGLYEVSNQGQVRSIRRTWFSGPEHRIAREVLPKIKMSKPDGGGYLRVTLSKKGKKNRISIHTLVLNTFVGEKPGYECRHLDGNKNNNKLDNLCWGTPKESAADRLKHGKTKNKRNP